MFFNGKKVVDTKPKECRKFIFTDESVRNYDYDSDAKSYTDSLCKGLRISISPKGNHSYFYQGDKHAKTIGSIYLK